MFGRTVQIFIIINVVGSESALRQRIFMPYPDWQYNSDIRYH